VAVIGAILRAQMIAMRRNLGKGAGLSIIGGVLWYTIWIGVGAGAYSYAVSAPAKKLDAVLSILLAAVCVYWQVMPVVSASMGSSLDLRKLLPFPIPHDRLFAIDLLLRLITCAEVLLVLFGGAAGVLANSSGGNLLLIIPAFAVFVVFNLLLASGIRSIVERLLARRKLREAMVVVMATVWMVPRFLFETGYRPRTFDRSLAAAQAIALPWGAAAHAARAHSLTMAWASLAVWVAVAAWFGRAQFERSLRFDSAAAQATGPASPTGTSLAEAFYRIPSRLLPDPLAAMVEKELRTLFRSPSFRNLFVMGFTFGLLIWLPMVIGRSADSASFLSRHFLTIVSAYSLTLLGQVTYWNCFAFDRSAVALWFAAPQSMAAVMVAKNIASQVPVYLEIAILTAITLPMRLVTGWSQVGEAVSVVAVTSIYMLAMGNITSVEYPRGVNPERASRGGGSGRFQMLSLVFYPLALLPVALAYLARYAFDSDAVFRAAMVVAAVVGAVIYKAALNSAVSTAGRKREAILQTLSAGEGPVVS
jgi:ABC-2 type transport system permease protein